jgi:hypothetical protein
MDQVVFMGMLASGHEAEGPARIPSGIRAGNRSSEEDGMILHLTSIDNIVEGRVHDPTQVKHGIINGRRITDLSWWIDPLTHLNLDLPGHLMEEVFVVSRLEKGSRILGDGSGFMYAPVEPVAYRHLGKVQAAGKRRLSLRPSAQM